MMFKIQSFLIFFLVLSGCENIKHSQKIDNEMKFYFKGQANLYLKNNKKKVIKKFYEFSYHENLAKLNVNKKCLEFIKINKLNGVNCKYAGTKFTEKILTSLN